MTDADADGATEATDTEYKRLEKDYKRLKKGRGGNGGGMQASINDETILLLQGVRERIGAPTPVRVLHTDDVDQLALIPTDGTSQHDYQVGEQGRVCIRWAGIPDGTDRVRVDVEETTIDGQTAYVVPIPHPTDPIPQGL